MFPRKRREAAGYYSAALLNINGAATEWRCGGGGGVAEQQHGKRMDHAKNNLRDKLQEINVVTEEWTNKLQADSFRPSAALALSTRLSTDDQPEELSWRCCCHY